MWSPRGSRHDQPLGHHVPPAPRSGVPPPRKRPVGRSGRMDETEMRVKGAWRSVDREVDTTGQTLACLRTESRAPDAAVRFRRPAIGRHGVPATLTRDGSEANDAAIKRDPEAYGTHLRIRQVKDLKHRVEQDHRVVTRVTRPMRGFKTFAAAQATLVGSELMHRRKTRQLVAEEGEETRMVGERFSSLAASSFHRQRPLLLHDCLSKICDTTIRCRLIA
jgi:putative transposase